MYRRLGRALLAAALLVSFANGDARAGTVTVFAAASLTDAMAAVGSAFGDRTGVDVRFSFAASSTLARQIEAGAPVDIFVSANELWMDHLEARGLVDPTTRISPISNRLVLVSPTRADDAPITLDSSLELEALLGPRGRLAVADPDHAPAGLYAREALETLGLWAAIEPRLARMDTVRAALTLVGRGEAPLGIVYATDAAISDAVRVVAIFPEATHRPISYSFAMIAQARRAGSAAAADVTALFAFMTGPEGRALFTEHGFAEP